MIHHSQIALIVVTCLTTPLIFREDCKTAPNRVMRVFLTPKYGMTYTYVVAALNAILCYIGCVVSRSIWTCLHTVTLVMFY